MTNQRKPSAQLDAEIAAALRAKALSASEAAKRRSDDAMLAPEQIVAAAAHPRAARLHKANKTDPGAEVVWLHDLAAINHRPAPKARASRAFNAPDPTRTKKSLAAYQEKYAAATEHGHMAQEYARQALAAARKRG